jgi:hypothetical protein
MRGLSNPHPITAAARRAAQIESGAGIKPLAPKARGDSRRCHDERTKHAVFAASSRFSIGRGATNPLQFEGARVSSKHRRAMQRRPICKWSVCELIEDEDG